MCIMHGFTVLSQHTEATRRLVIARGLQIQGSMDLSCSQERQTTPSLYGCGTTPDQTRIALQPNWRYIIKLNSSESTNNPSLRLDGNLWSDKLKRLRFNNTTCKVSSTTGLCRLAMHNRCCPLCCGMLTSLFNSMETLPHSEA